MKRSFILSGLVALALFSSLDFQLSTARAETTVFTYQGRLSVNGDFANGTFDMRFRLFTSETGGLQVRNDLTGFDVSITDGAFDVTLDFEAEDFLVKPRFRWLEIAVRNNGQGAFHTLSPRRQITAAPCATYASNAGQLSGAVPDDNVSFNVALLDRSPQTFSGGTNVFTGRVGTGTAGPNPSTALTLKGVGASSGFLQFQDSAGANQWHLTRENGGLNFVESGVATDRLLLEDGGNVGIGVSDPTNRLHVAGGVSATAFVNTSDRNAKENFAPVSPLAVLNKVIALPITRWNYKDMKDGQHLGPVAQDFYEAFHLGGSDKTITSVDTDGVALAAIQGLNQKLTEELKRRDADNAELKQAVAELKALVNKLAGQRQISHSVPQRDPVGVALEK